MNQVHDHNAGKSDVYAAPAAGIKGKGSSWSWVFTGSMQWVILGHHLCVSCKCVSENDIYTATITIR